MEQAAAIDQEWNRFTADLALCLADLQKNQALIVSVKGATYRVYFLRETPKMHVEAASNITIEPPEARLSTEACDALTTLGWHPPTGHEPEGPQPNFFLDLKVPVDSRALAALTSRTFREVYRVRHPGELECDAFSKDYPEISSPDLRALAPSDRDTSRRLGHQRGHKDTAGDFDIYLYAYFHDSGDFVLESHYLSDAPDERGIDEYESYVSVGAADKGRLLAALIPALWQDLPAFRAWLHKQRIKAAGIVAAGPAEEDTGGPAHGLHVGIAPHGGLTIGGGDTGDVSSRLVLPASATDQILLAALEAAYGDGGFLESFGGFAEWCEECGIRTERFNWS